MKKTVLFLALFSSSLLAQPAKVLICASGDLNAAKALDTTLQKFYHNSIDVSDTLTESINNYEAVFLMLDWRHRVTQQSGEILKAYLHSKRKLYVEHDAFMEYGSPHAFDSNGFWRFVGVTSIDNNDNEFSSIEYVSGVKGKFAEGLRVRNP